MTIRVIVATVVGAAVGGTIGYFGRCASGACPLTSNPISGMLFGGLIGAMLAAGN